MTTDHAPYDQFVQQDFAALPPGKFAALDIAEFYTVLVGREPSSSLLFNISLLNHLTGAVIPVYSPQEDIKIHVDKAITFASARITEYYQAIAALEPNLE